MGTLLGTLYSFPVLSLPIAEEFAQGRGAVAAAFSIRLLIGAAGQALLGSLVDRYGPRRIGAIGAGVISFAFFLTGQVDALWQLYLSFGVLAALGSSLLELSILSSLTKNFTERRGTAIGITWGGGGFGLFVLVLLTQLLVDNLGWRATYSILGLIIGSLIPLVSATLHPGPDESHAVEHSKALFSFRLRGLSTSAFWLLFLGNLLIGIFDEAVYQHAVPYARYLGYSGMAAASAIGLASILYVPGQILGGSLSDRLGREVITTGACALMVTGLSLLLGLSELPFRVYQIAMVSYGLGLGACIATRTASWGDIYEGKSFAAIVGIIWSAYAIGGAFIAWFGGWAFDTNKSYVPTFAIALVATVIWCALLWIVGPRRFRRRSELESEASSFGPDRQIDE